MRRAGVLTEIYFSPKNHEQPLLERNLRQYDHGLAQHSIHLR